MGTNKRQIATNELREILDAERRRVLERFGPAVPRRESDSSAVDCSAYGWAALGFYRDALAETDNVAAAADVEFGDYFLGLYNACVTARA